MQAQAPIIYRVDFQNEIVFVNGAWNSFALEQGNPHLVGEKVIGRPLSEFISDPTTRELYEQILQIVRSGKPVEFAYRCDLPDARRLMNMKLELRDEGEIEFTSSVTSIEPRPYQELNPQAVAKDLLTMRHIPARGDVSARWPE